ncbi:MAG: response regulator, partial [Desulfobacula sp.]|nr:response regulator [Desulfobacula sp.]
NMLKLILTRNGFMVDTAESGEEGIKKIDLKNYTLTLTDIKMPGISGDQVLDYLRNIIKKSVTAGKAGGLIVNRSKRSKNHEPPKGGQNNSN